MRSPATSLVLLLTLAAACAATDPRLDPGSGAPPHGAAAPPRTLDEQVQELARSSQPGSMHKRLEPLVGLWSVELCEVADDQRERALARGAAELKWVHEGRFLSWGATLEAAGTTSGFLGYDLRAGQYQLLMISSLSSGMGVATGYGDLSGQGVRFTQETLDAPTGRRMRMTSVLRLIERNHFVLDAEGRDDRGQERVVLRTHYRRVVAKP